MTYDDRGPCHYIYHHKAQLYSSSGPTPEESGCNHPDSQGGICAKSECPLYPEPAEPCPWCGEEMAGDDQVLDFDADGEMLHADCKVEALVFEAERKLDDMKGGL